MKFHKLGVAACIIEWCWWSKNENKAHENQFVDEKMNIYHHEIYPLYSIVVYRISLWNKDTSLLFPTCELSIRKNHNSYLCIKLLKLILRPKNITESLDYEPSYDKDNHSMSN